MNGFLEKTNQKNVQNVNQEIGTRGKQMFKEGFFKENLPLLLLCLFLIILTIIDFDWLMVCLLLVVIYMLFTHHKQFDLERLKIYRWVEKLNFEQLKELKENYKNFKVKDTVKEMDSEIEYDGVVKK